MSVVFDAANQCAICLGPPPLTDGVVHVNTGEDTPHRWGHRCVKCNAATEQASADRRRKRDAGLCAMPRCENPRADDRPTCGNHGRATRTNAGKETP